MSAQFTPDLGCSHVTCGSVHGLDFCDEAIRLAKSVRKLYREKELEQQRQEHGGALTTQTAETTDQMEPPKIHYMVADALATGLESGSFDLIYDKGLFDSIACVSKKFVKNLQDSENETTPEESEAEPQQEEDDDDRIKFCQEVNRHVYADHV